MIDSDIMEWSENSGNPFGAAPAPLTGQALNDFKADIYNQAAKRAESINPFIPPAQWGLGNSLDQGNIPNITDYLMRPGSRDELLQRGPYRGGLNGVPPEELLQRGPYRPVPGMSPKDLEKKL